MCRARFCRSPKPECSDVGRDDGSLLRESVNISDEDFQFLSRNSSRRPRHALLAIKPEEARQTTSCARWQAEHDPADGGAPAADGSGQAFLDHHEPRSPASNLAPASAVAPTASTR